MFKHALDDVVSPPAVLDDPCEIAREKVDRLVDPLSPIRVECREHRRRVFLQLVQQFGGQAGEVVDEVERVFNFVGNS